MACQGTWRKKTMEESKVDKEVEKSTTSLATKEDLANVKSDIVKWMFIFWAGTVALTGILKSAGLLKKGGKDQSNPRNPSRHHKLHGIGAIHIQWLDGLFGYQKMIAGKVVGMGEIDRYQPR